MYDQFIRKRITELRIQKDISERQMSMDLGHSPSYINGIVSGAALPAMAEFLYICEYLNVSPKEFFDDGAENPVLLREVTEDLRSLNENQIRNIHEIIKGLKK